MGRAGPGSKFYYTNVGMAHLFHVGPEAPRGAVLRIPPVRGKRVYNTSVGCACQIRNAERPVQDLQLVDCVDKSGLA